MNASISMLHHSDRFKVTESLHVSALISQPTHWNLHQILVYCKFNTFEWQEHVFVRLSQELLPLISCINMQPANVCLHNQQKQLDESATPLRQPGQILIALLSEALKSSISVDLLPLKKWSENSRVWLTLNVDSPQIIYSAADCVAVVGENHMNWVLHSNMLSWKVSRRPGVKITVSDRWFSWQKKAAKKKRYKAITEAVLYKVQKLKYTCSFFLLRV